MVYIKWAWPCPKWVRFKCVPKIIDTIALNSAIVSMLKSRGGRTSFKSHVTSAFQYCARTTIAGSLGSIRVALVSSRSMHYVWKECSLCMHCLSALISSMRYQDSMIAPIEGAQRGTVLQT